MMTRDEAVTARINALKLERLYHAYRAASRASAMVMTRISVELAEEENERDPNRHFRLQQRLVREMAVSRENDLVFQNRIEQLRRRIDELDKYEGIS